MYGFYDQAADVLAQNVELSYKNLTPEIYAFLDATIQLQTSPEEAYRCSNSRLLVTRCL